jgi:DNA-binding transcriptional ArsR family regulator
MSSTERQISDPERIRALAHPVRLELLDFLGEVEHATATECAARIGESVASCSFHLRMLEKYGYIERAERRGREKPWRAVSKGWNLRPTLESKTSIPAIAEVAALNVARESERMHRFLAQLDQEPLEWLEASTVTTSTFWATADELAELSRELTNLTRRFAGRGEDPSLRPDGARPARLFATANPEPSKRAESNDG